MFEQYHGLDISFFMGKTRVRVLNIALERMERSIPGHSHGAGSYELHYTASGCGQLLAGERLYNLAPGSMYLVGPHAVHAQIPDLEKPPEDYCVYMQLIRGEEDANEVAERFANVHFWIGQDEQGMLPLFERLFQELRNRPVGYTLWVETLVKQLILCVVRDVCPAPGTQRFEPATPEEAQAFIIEESFLYEYPTLTLRRLADKLGLGVRQTQRLLMERYGKNFQTKRGEARMSAASILLAYTGRSVASVAEELGYSSAEHFTVAFKRWFGISAGEYRKQHAVKAAQEQVLDPPLGLGSASVERR